MREYHSFQLSTNPRYEKVCLRCGLSKSAPCHFSLLDRVEGLREAYLNDRLVIDDFAKRLPSGWIDYPNDPNEDGRQLSLLIRGVLAEFQVGYCDELELRERIAATR